MLKTVKLLVLFMGLMILGGLGLLAYGVYARNEPAAKPPVAAAPTPAPAGMTAEAPVGTGEGFGIAALGEPAGSTIAGMVLSGRSLAVTVRGGGQDDRVVVFDLPSGTVVGRVHVGAMPAAAVESVH